MSAAPGYREETPCYPGGPKVGRRAAPRLRLWLPGRLITLYDSRHCVLMNVSRTGAMIGLDRPLETGESAVLQFAGREIFCEILRCRIGSAGGINGLEFEPELTDEDVLALRRVSESFREDEQRALRTEVRAWVLGTIR